MKTRIFFVTAAVLVFGLGIATFAYKQTSSAKAAAAACCCKGDSCPMKAGKGEHRVTAAAEHKMDADHEAMSGEHKCCGESCPMMKKKDSQTKVSGASASDEGKSCCDNCDCCSSKARAKTSTV